MLNKFNPLVLIKLRSFSCHSIYAVCDCVLHISHNKILFPALRLRNKYYLLIGNTISCYNLQNANLLLVTISGTAMVELPQLFLVFLMIRSCLMSTVPGKFVRFVDSLRYVNVRRIWLVCTLNQGCQLLKCQLRLIINPSPLFPLFSFLSFLFSPCADECRVATSQHWWFIWPQIPSTEG